MQKTIPHFSALSALRFFVAVTIAFGHTMGYLNKIETECLNKLGIPTLMVFFHVLSGFTLAYIYPQLNDRAQVFRFWLARIGRIWPVHILVLALIIVCFPERNANNGAWWWSFFSNATLTQSWFPAFGAPLAFNGPAWTISTELALYLLFPFLIQRWQRIWCWALPAFFLLALSVTIFASYSDANPASFFHRLKIDPTGFVYLHPSTRLFEFAVGMTLALFWEKASACCRAGTRLGTALEIGALAFVMMTIVGSPIATEALRAKFHFGNVWSLWLERMLLPLVPYACLVLIFSLNRGYISRALSGRWLVFLGELSFSIYLVHVLLIWLIISSPLTPLKVWGSSAAFWCCVLLAAHLIYTLWEQPWRKFFRSLLPLQDIKLIPDAIPERPSLKSRWRLPALEFVLLAALLSAVHWEKRVRSHLQYITEAQAKNLVKKNLPKLLNVQFGDGFVLEGVIHQWSESGLQLQLVWRSLKEQGLDKIVAVHCIDADGKLLGGADYPQEVNRKRVAIGERWVDTVMLRHNQLKDAVSIGLGMYRLGEDLIPIDRGRRDWRDRRLLIDIATQLPSVTGQTAAGPAQF